MHAARCDAAEVRADVAAVRQTRAITQQQTTEHRRNQRKGRNLQAWRETSCKPRRHRRTQHDADIHDGGDVFPHRSRQRLGVRWHLPEHPAADVDAQAARDFRAPQRERRGDAPRATGQGQGRVVEQRQGNRAPDQRPRATQETTQAHVLAGDRSFQFAMTAFFQLDRDQRDHGEQRQAHDQRRHHAEGLDDGGGRERRQGEPPVSVVSGDHRTDDEEQQGHQHPRVAAAHGEQGARCTAAAHLHANAEDERPEHHRNARWRDQPGDRRAEQRACAQGREEQHYGNRQHDHLRPQACAAALVDEHAPGGGEAECGVVQGQAQRCADDQQQDLLAADSGLKEQSADHQQDESDQRRAELALRRRGEREAHGCVSGCVCDGREYTP